jgi:hypothetical protein
MSGDIPIPAAARLGSIPASARVAGGQLVDGRLADAGGQHGQDAAVGGCGPDRLLLAGAELLDSEGSGGPAGAGRE